jgi:hypothetical protein
MSAGFRKLILNGSKRLSGFEHDQAKPIAENVKPTIVAYLAYTQL